MKTKKTTAKQVMVEVKNLLSVSEFGIIDRPKNKIFVTKSNTTKIELQPTIDEMVDMVNFITAEDQLNGVKPKTVLYAFLNESGPEKCEGFSFQVR